MDLFPHWNKSEHPLKVASLTFNIQLVSSIGFCFSILQPYYPVFNSKNIWRLFSPLRKHSEPQSHRAFLNSIMGSSSSLCIYVFIYTRLHHVLLTNPTRLHLDRVRSDDTNLFFLRRLQMDSRGVGHVFIHLYQTYSVFIVFYLEVKNETNISNKRKETSVHCPCVGCRHYLISASLFLLPLLFNNKDGPGVCSCNC